VEKEFQIMLSLSAYEHFPKVIEFQKCKEHSYVIMDKFDHTLNEHFVTRNKKFSLPTIALLTDQCFTAMRIMHQAGYLHRDLKP
jgi:serine/threonine protein kinase